MTESVYPPAILKALAEVRAAVPSVPKTGFNSFHKYQYSSESDVLAAYNPAMNKAGLLVLPSVIASHEKPIKTGAGKDSCITSIVMEFTLAHVGGAVWPDKLRWEAQGEDGQDKGIAKAITSGTKYFLTSLFQAEKGTDPDADGGAPAHKPPPNPPAQVPHDAGNAQAAHAEVARGPSKPKCPNCHEGKAVIPNKFDGGWVCFKKKDGCGHKWHDDPAPASTQGAPVSGTEAASAQEGLKGSPPLQTVLTALYNGMKAAAEKDGLAGLVKWWREHQKEIKAPPEPGANQIAAWKEEFKSVLEIGGGE